MKYLVEMIEISYDTKEFKIKIKHQLPFWDGTFVFSGVLSMNGNENN